MQKQVNWLVQLIHNKFRRKEKPHSLESELTQLSEIQKSYERTAWSCIYAATRVASFHVIPLGQIRQGRAFYQTVAHPTFIQKVEENFNIQVVQLFCINFSHC